MTDPVNADLSSWFEEQVTPLRKPLYRHALRLTRRHEDAEDLVQDAIVRAYAHIDTFRTGSNFGAWIYRITTNVYLNDRRRIKAFPRFDITEAQIQSAEWHASFGSMSAEDQLLRGWPDDDLRAAMLALPERLRLVIFYFEVQQLTNKEIAEAMCIPIGTVMSRLHRGRKQLRVLLADGV